MWTRCYSLLASTSRQTARNRRCRTAQALDNETTDGGVSVARPEEHARWRRRLRVRRTSARLKCRYALRKRCTHQAAVLRCSVRRVRRATPGATPRVRSDGRTPQIMGIKIQGSDTRSVGSPPIANTSSDVAPVSLSTPLILVDQRGDHPEREVPPSESRHERPAGGQDTGVASSGGRRNP